MIKEKFYITDLPVDNIANAVNIVRAILGQDIVISKITLEMFKEKLYICNHISSGKPDMHCWSDYRKPHKQHVIYTYSEFTSKYSPVSSELLNYENIRRFEIFLLQDSIYYNLSKLVNNCDEYNIFAQQLFDRYVILASKFFDKELNYDECNIISNLQKININY